MNNSNIIGKIHFSIRHHKRLVHYTSALLTVLCILVLSCGCRAAATLPAEPASAPSEEELRNEKLVADIGAGNLILVNKEHAVERDFKADDLVEITDHYATDREQVCRYMRSEAAEQFIAMTDAAAAEGIDLVMTTAYRSYDYQNVLWTNNVKAKGSEELANMTSARPGESEHQTGLAVDLSTDEIGYKISYDFADTEAGRWIENNAHKYGFILRYLDGKTDQTGYLYEPWHVRYVGLTAATEIKDKGITLEEYLELPDVKALLD